MEKRRSDFRNLHQETSSGPKKSKKAKRGKKVTEQKVESSSPSENLVEEVMLLSHTVLEPYYDHIVNQRTKAYLKEAEEAYREQAQKEKEERKVRLEREKEERARKKKE